MNKKITLCLVLFPVICLGAKADIAVDFSMDEKNVTFGEYRYLKNESFYCIDCPRYVASQAFFKTKNGSIKQTPEQFVWASPKHFTR